MQINDNVLIADEGMKITDGEGYYSKVVLSNIDSVERYTEIPISEISFSDTESEAITDV